MRDVHDVRPRRHVVDGVLVSAVEPALRFRPAGEYAYLGAVTFLLKGVAAVERHNFGVASGGTIERMLVVQFEAYLASARGAYRYAIADGVELGGAVYGYSEGTLVVSEEIAEDPAAEMAQTVTFLTELGLRVDDRHAMARFARVVGDERRAEILIFYHERGASLSGLRERALAQFTID